MINPQNAMTILRALFIAGGLFVAVIPWILTNPNQTLRHDEGQVGCGFFSVLVGAGFIYIGATL